MSRSLSFLPHMRLAWRAEICRLSDELRELGLRLGTPAERPEDFAEAQRSRQRLTTLQLASVGLAALAPPRRQRLKPRLLPVNKVPPRRPTLAAPVRHIA